MKEEIDILITENKKLMDTVEGNAEKLAEIDKTVEENAEKLAEIDKNVEENAKKLKFLRKGIAKYLEVNMFNLD